jgi:anti-sigma factor RsiW
VDEPELTEREQADLAAYADGSLPRARRRELEARLGASASLREALERQRMALATVRAAEEEPAPERLRARLRDQDARRPAPQTRPRPRMRLRPLLGAAAAATIALVGVLVLSTGGAGTADLAEAAARAPEAPAPGRADELRLAASSDGIAFPDWEPRLGWRATGARTDEVDGRQAVTVTYERRGREVAYAILGRPALDLPDGDDAYRELTHEGRPAVTWIRGGRTCLLLGGDGVDEDTLRRLAESVRFY